MATRMTRAAVVPAPVVERLNREFREGARHWCLAFQLRELGADQRPSNRAIFTIFLHWGFGFGQRNLGGECRWRRLTMLGRFRR